MANKPTSSQVDTPHFTFSSNDMSVKFKFDGFLSPGLMKLLTVDLDPAATPLKSSQEGGSSTVICNFNVAYPKLPRPIRQVTVSEVVIVRPSKPTSNSKFGPTYTIGIKAEVLDPFIKAAEKQNYNFGGNLNPSNGYYWINSTTDMKNPDLMCMMFESGKKESGEPIYSKLKLGDHYSVMHQVEDEQGNPANAVGYANVDFKLKTQASNSNVSFNNQETRKFYTWTISAKMYSFYLKDCTSEGPSSATQPQDLFDRRMVAPAGFAERVKRITGMYEDDEEE